MAAKKTTKKTKKKVVKKRPKSGYDTFDWEQLANYCQFKPNLKTVCEMMKVSDSTLQKYLKRKFDETFTEHVDRKMSGIRLKLVQKAIKMALEGDRVMLIFCLKNYCKWSDTPEIDQDENYELEFIAA